MILDQRVFHNSTSISTLVNDYRTGAYTFPYATGDYLYIGSILPFNNLWFELGTVNAVTAACTVEIWFGNAWTSAVDLIDETSVSGKSLAQSGRIQFTTDLLKGWDYEQNSFDVDGLETTRVYNMYWARLSWNATLTNTMTLKYIGQKFSNDDILYSFYPDLAQTGILTAFESGKTSWDEQHYMAAEHIVRDLKKRNLIKARAQLLDFGLFVDASCHKVAELVYKSFGSPYFEQMSQARKDYNEAVDIKFINADQNANGQLDPLERRLMTGFMER
jgi:hypothetical protein